MSATVSGHSAVVASQLGLVRALGGRGYILVTEYYGEHWMVAESLSQKLGIPYQPCQDWEFTQACPDKLEAWLTVFDSDSLSPAERTLLLSLLISSYRSGAEVGLDQRQHLPRLSAALATSEELSTRMEFFWWHGASAEDRELVADIFERSRPAT